MAIKGLKNRASKNRAATTRPVKPVRPPCATPAALSIKLVTVLVPKAAHATVPTASESMAWRARGSLLSWMKPACSQTPMSVPTVSKTSMNRNTNTKGSI